MTETPAPCFSSIFESLEDVEKQFVVAYQQSGYSLSRAQELTGMPWKQSRALLNDPKVKKAILEVQEDLDSISILNEKWVNAQLMRLMPMVMGDEDIPIVLANGDQVYRKKAMPDVALKIVEYVRPKAHKPSVMVNVGRDFSAMPEKELDDFIENNMMLVRTNALPG